MIYNSQAQTMVTERRCNRGFTLTEIITVVAIIIILLGVLVPAILSIQRKARPVETKALFGKLIASLALYQKDFGAYPDLSGTLIDGDVLIELNNPEQWSRFAEILALSQPDGSAFGNPEDRPLIKEFNPKLKRYFDLQLGELEVMDGSTRLVDAHGNPHIRVVVDTDMDGIITTGSLPEGEEKALRQRIVVYTTEEGNDDYKALTSWDS